MYRTALLITLIVYIFCPTAVKSQCGLTPVLEIDIGPLYKLTMTSANSVLNPNCIIYQIEWICNGNYAGNMVQEDLPAGRGFNEIAFKAWVLDTLTNDSCYTEYTNIYISSGDKPYVGVNAFVNGLDVSTSPQFWAELQPWGNYYIGWGDTTQGSNQQFASHTYAQAGYYILCATVDDGLNFADQSCITVNAGNGLPTMENQYSFGTINGPGVGCSTIVEHNFNSVPFMTYVSYGYDFLPGTTKTIIPPASTVVRDTLRIPGRLMLLYSYGDPNSTLGVAPLFYSAVLVNPCDIVPDTIRGFCWNDDDGDALIDSTEGPAVGVNVIIDSYQATTDSLGNYELIMPLSQITLTVSQTTSFPSNGKYTILPNTSKLHDNYDFGIVNFTVRKSGRAFLDNNNDTIYNTGDQPLANAYVRGKNKVTGRTYSARSNSNGIYNLLVPAGSYKFSAHYSQVDSVTVYPDSIVINNATGIYNNQNYAFRSTANGVNLCNQMIGSGEARPGFQYQLRCAITNRGLDTASSVLTISYDPSLIGLSAIPANGIIDSINSTVTWNVNTINFGTYLSYSLHCSIPSTLPLGQSIQCSSVVTVNAPASDYYLANNSRTVNQNLIGSFDPNDKLVNPKQIDLTPGFQNPNEFMYHINFQNTGTASAINVIVQDEIDPNLDITTFNMIGASHSYITSIVDRTVTWKFFNINLPDSNSNEPGSHGFIEFSISPTPNLPVGTNITNEAAIYFDFNAPINTNTVVTDYVISTALLTALDRDKLFVFPNPTDDIINIRSNEPIEQISVFNSMGSIVHDANYMNGSSNLLVDISQYNKGMYFVRVSIANKYYYRKVLCF